MKKKLEEILKLREILLKEGFRRTNCVLWREKDISEFKGQFVFTESNYSGKVLFYDKNPFSLINNLKDSIYSNLTLLYVPIKNEIY